MGTMMTYASARKARRYLRNPDKIGVRKVAARRAARRKDRNAVRSGKYGVISRGLCDRDVS